MTAPSDYEAIGGDGAGVHLETIVHADYQLANEPFVGFGSWFYRAVFTAQHDGFVAAVQHHQPEWRQGLDQARAAQGRGPVNWPPLWSPQPVEQPPAPPSTPPGVMDGSIDSDEIDPRSVTWVGGPSIGTFTKTASMRSVSIERDGVRLAFTKQTGPDRWPDQPFGAAGGNLQYCLGMICRVDGRWVGSAPDERWFGRDISGGPIQSQDIGDGTGRGQVAANWFYDRRWGALEGYQPKPGELIGLFVVAGDARNNNCPLEERSNIIVVALPQPGTTQTFTRP